MKEIKLTLAFDVSTTMTGYALLVNGKPINYKHNKLSIGQIDMNYPIIKHKNYGDKMFHNSFVPIWNLQNIILQCLHNINENIKMGKYKLKNFNIVFEISQIPNFTKFNGFISITSVKKLSLYTGMVFQAVSNSVHNSLHRGWDKAVVKLIKPIEWQNRLWDKQGDREKTKLKSIEFANTWLKKWGINQTLTMEQNDMADAINIASVAEEVRDDINASNKARKKQKDIKINLENKILKARNNIAKLTDKAMTKKQTHLEKILSAKTTKFNYQDEKEKKLVKFLDKTQTQMYNRQAFLISKYEIELKKLRNNKVIQRKENIWK